MSNLIVEICKVENVQRHNNSDNLDLAQIKGWQIVIKRNEYKEGDKVVFIPPDSLVPYDLAKKLNIVNYLSIVKFNPEVLRVKAVRLRNEPSYGVPINPIDVGLSDVEVGEDVAERLGISKYEPPTVELQGNAARDVANFPRYTGIEHYNNFPDVITRDDYVIISEKAHGQSNRVGKIAMPDEEGNLNFEYVAGSHNVRRKQDEDCRYWKPFYDPRMKNLIDFLHNAFQTDVIVYSEIIGKGIQDMSYGIEGPPQYRTFDIMIGGKYLDYVPFKKYCEQFEVPTVPVLFEGYFEPEKVKELTHGDTTLCPADKAGKFKGREGCVIRLGEERYDRRVGRVILKSVSSDYLARKGGTDSH